MTTPETNPATPRTPTKTYNLAQSVLSLDGVPFPAAGGDAGAVMWEFAPSRTPDDVRNAPKPGDAVYDGDVCWVVCGYNADGTKLHVVGITPENTFGAQDTILLDAWKTPTDGCPVYVPRTKSATLSNDGKTWELFPGPRPARTFAVDVALTPGVEA